LRRSAGVGKMRPVMMPSPPALETALANSAYPTYWNRSPESVSHRGFMAVRPPGGHVSSRGDDVPCRWHESAGRNHRKLRRASWQARETYHHTALNDGYCGSCQLTASRGHLRLLAGLALPSSLLTSNA
jgi:hypothetical protein